MAAVRDALSDLPLITLEPTVYMDNLLAPWSLPAVVSGTFAYQAPAEASVAWISHRTLAQAVLAAATAPLVGQSLRIGGPADLVAARLTGPRAPRPAPGGSWLRRASRQPALEALPPIR